MVWGMVGGRVEESRGWEKLQVTVLDSWMDGEKRRGRGREHLELSAIPHPKNIRIGAG